MAGDYMETILEKIKELEISGIENVSLIALVSDTSSEVIFYCDYKGEHIQSNDLIEEYNVNPMLVENLYKLVTAEVRKAIGFKKDMMNILYVNNGKIKLSYDKKICSTYKIIKAWNADNQ